MRPYGIPQVLGFILSGLVLSVLNSQFNFISDLELLEALEILAVVALGFIGFNIGAELKWTELKKIDKKLLYVLLVDSLGTFLIVSVLIYNFTHLSLVFSMLMGALASATAPAATADVLWEYKAKGPLTQSILFILALDDIIAIFLVLITTEIAKAEITGVSAQFGDIVATFSIETIAALGIGLLAGLALVVIFNRVKDHGEVLVLLLGALFFVISLSQILDISSILACMVFGMVLSSLSKKDTTQTFHEIFKLGSPIVAMFFIVLGLSLNIADLRLLGGIGLVYLVGRTLGKVGGVSLTARLVGTPKRIQKYLGWCLMSQAGVALGLAAKVQSDFQGTIAAADAVLIFTTITATTIILQIIGPILVKWAINSSGEGMDKILDVAADSLII